MSLAIFADGTKIYFSQVSVLRCFKQKLEGVYGVWGSWRGQGEAEVAESMGMLNDEGLTWAYAYIYIYTLY